MTCNLLWNKLELELEYIFKQKPIFSQTGFWKFWRTQGQFLSISKLMKIMKIWHFWEFCHFYPILDCHKITTERNSTIAVVKIQSLSLKCVSLQKIVLGWNRSDSNQSQNTLKSEHFPAVVDIEYYHLLSIRHAVSQKVAIGFTIMFLLICS